MTDRRFDSVSIIWFFPNILHNSIIFAHIHWRYLAACSNYLSEPPIRNIMWLIDNVSKTIAIQRNNANATLKCQHRFTTDKDDEAHIHKSFKYASISHTTAPHSACVSYWDLNTTLRIYALGVWLYANGRSTLACRTPPHECMYIYCQGVWQVTKCLLNTRIEDIHNWIINASTNQTDGVRLCVSESPRLHWITGRMDNYASQCLGSLIQHALRFTPIAHCRMHSRIVVYTTPVDADLRNMWSFCAVCLQE